MEVEEMADITSPQAIRFCNENVRIIADLTEKLRRTGEQFLINVVEFETITSGNANGDVVLDGAASDGRQICTKQSVAEVKYVVEQLVACLNQDDRETLIHNLVTNGQPAF